MPRKESITAPATAQSQQDASSDGIDNYELPKTLVTRIAKSSIPESSKLQKDTVTALVKGSTVFINYLAATAHDIATSRQHKSVSASDVLKALELIQFGDMVEPLQQELQVYRENMKNSKKTSANKAGAGGGESASVKSKSAKGKGKERAATSSAVVGNGAGEGDAEMGDVDNEGEGDEGDEELEDELGEEEDELEEDIDDELEPEPEELVDQMAVDEEELRHDERRADLGDIDPPANVEEGKK
ncbi:histone-fold-containing protein [Phellopilus nigrolimitatus]|nr:histone-fold-containing protein [Phellopilus nigrolimitatus]